MRRLISLFILIAGLAGPAFAQESDKDYLTRWLEENLSSAGREVVITGFRGALSSQASLDELTIADDVGIWLTLRGVTLDWSRAALLSGRVEIKTLTASEILLPRGPLTGGTLPAPEASSFSLPELPVSVQIDTLKADRVALGEALFGAAAEVSLEGAMSLAGGEGEATLAIRRIDGAEGALTLAGSYSNASRQLALDLDVAEAADGIAANLIGLPGAPALVLTIAGAGPIDDYAADIRLATDGQERLAGRVVLTSEVGADALAAKRFHAELGGDIAPLLAPDYAAFFGRDVRLVSDGTWLADGRVEVSKLEIGAAAITLSGRARLGADHLPEIIALTGRIADPHGGMVVLPLPGARSELRSATLDLRFDAAKGDDWTGSVQLTDLQRSEGSAASLTLTGSGRIARDAAGAGTVDAKLRFSGSGVVAANPALAEALGSTLSGALEAHWRAGQALDLPAFSLRGAGYAVTGAGTLGGLDTGLRFAGQIKAQVDNLALGSALAGRTLSGAAEAGIAGSTELLSGVFDLDAWIQGVDLGIGQTEADNALRGPTSIAVSAKRDATGIELRSLVIRAATLTANAAGRIETGATRVEGGFDFTDLASLGGPYGGALRGSAVVLTDARGPAVTLAATGRGLRTGTAELDQVLDGISLVTLQARLQGDAVALTRLDLHAAGLVADISGSLQPGASRLVANLQFPDLAVLGPGYRGAVQAKAELAETGTARQVTLTGIGSDLGIGQTNIDRLLRGATLLTLDVVQDQGRVRINTAKLENPQLLATASGIQTADGRSLEVAARLSDMASLAPGFPGVLTLQGALQETAAGYNLDITGVGPGNIQAKVTGTAAIGFGTVDLAIAGTAAAGLVNALVAPANLSGPVRYDLRLSGPPGLAALSGTVSTQGLRIVTQIFGQTLEGVTATATLAGGQAQITATAGVANAPGQISVSGPVSLTAPYNGQLAIGLAGPLAPANITTSP